MVTPEGYNSCEQIQSYFSFYSVPVAALLWCGVPNNQIEQHISKAIQTNVRGVFTLPYMKCFELRCRAIHIAIESGKLPVCREKGVVVDDHVAPERRHVKREDLKKWIAIDFPDDKPVFLFDKVERNTHSSINSKAFQVLQVDRDAINIKLNSLTKEHEGLLEENQALKSCLEKMQKDTGELNSKSETTYLNIIGAMLNLMLGASPNGQKHSVFVNQSAIISALLGYHEGKPGISSRTLDTVFPKAKKSINS